MIKTDLDYDTGTNLLPPGAFRISASQFNLWVSKPHQWYREVVLGEEGFTGNTASVLGTCVHYIAEMYAKDLTPDTEQIEQYITNHESNEDVDCDEVRKHYKQMGIALVNQYIAKNRPNVIEKFITTEIQPGFFAGGSVDAIDNDCIIDYKTYNSKTKPRAIPMNYRYQLLIYAKAAMEKGIDITRIRLVYINRNIDGGISEKTGRPLKSYPPEVTVLTEMITDEDMEFITSILNLCVDTVKLAIEKPEYSYILFRDYRLKER